MKSLVILYAWISVILCATSVLIHSIGTFQCLSLALEHFYIRLNLHLNFSISNLFYF